MKAIFITVRTGSKRLANKCLLKINGIPTIEHLIRRVKKSKKTDLIILCTSNNKEDDILCDIAVANNINYYRGSSKDKLERWNGACNKYQVNFFVTADGDDLFCDPELIDLAFNQYDQSNGGIDFIVQQWLFNEVIANHDYLLAKETIDPKLLESMNSEIKFVHIEQELSWLLSIFKAKGFDVFGANFTTETIGFPVAKVFIPGMRHFWPRFAPGRLFNVPVELGYLDQATSESDLNKIGFFF